MSEFTGERVIPGLVDENLFNEHLARYRFAARFSGGMRVLDAGCGSGYGSAELANAESVISVDISEDAIHLAREKFLRPGTFFLRGSCEALPFADGAFGLVTAFEVIEHLTEWQKLLTEARRVLRQEGVLLVSTPNKSYYAESRAGSGPNPFHTHEFEYEEFRQTLYEVFPHVRLWTQNHSEAIVFAPLNPAGAHLDARGNASPEHANFYLAMCSGAEISANKVFAWMPSTGNVLREREHHVAKLEGELAKKDSWLQQLIGEHADLLGRHEATLAELRERNEWAAQLNRDIEEARGIVASLQEEAGAQLGWIRDLEAVIATADAQILQLTGVIEELQADIATGQAEILHQTKANEQLQADIASGHAEILRLVGSNQDLEADLVVRTRWAQSLEEQLSERTRHVEIQAREVAELKELIVREAGRFGTESARLGAMLTEQSAHFEAMLTEQSAYFEAALAEQSDRFERLLAEQTARTEALLSERRLIARSRWLRLGRRLKLGPVVGE